MWQNRLFFQSKGNASVSERNFGHKYYSTPTQKGTPQEKKGNHKKKTPPTQLPTVLYSTKGRGKEEDLPPPSLPEKRAPKPSQLGLKPFFFQIKAGKEKGDVTFGALFFFFGGGGVSTLFLPPRFNIFHLTSEGIFFSALLLPPLS